MALVQLSLVVSVVALVPDGHEVINQRGSPIGQRVNLETQGFFVCPGRHKARLESNLDALCDLGLQLRERLRQRGPLRLLNLDL